MNTITLTAPLTLSTLIGRWISFFGLDEKQEEQKRQLEEKQELERKQAEETKDRKEREARDEELKAKAA